MNLTDYILVGISIILAVLLALRAIAPIVSTGIFILCLVILGELREEVINPEKNRH